jgi:hypothetical protein
MEMKKPAARRAIKSQSLQQPSDCPWDTLKAQILQKISISLCPHIINFDNYTILFYITRIIPKPGMPLTTLQEYTFMIEQVGKTKNPLVNLTITENEKEGEEDKENKADVEDDGSKLKKSKVRICILSYIIRADLCPQGKKKAPVYTANLEKTAHIQAL